MNERTPDFSELIGEDVSVEERARLEQAHSMLMTAGPLPELPLGLQQAPAVEDPHDSSVAFSFLPRRGGRILTLAAGFALLCLIVGYVIGNHRSGFTTDFTVAMGGTPAAPQASAVLKVGKIDSVGNWPLELQVVGLKQLPKGSWYTLYLTKNKQPVESCGTFRVNTGTTTVRMNAPYNFRNFDGWIVTAQTATGKPGPPLLAKYGFA
jgi:hypothetical protein